MSARTIAWDTGGLHQADHYWMPEPSSANLLLRPLPPHDPRDLQRSFDAGTKPATRRVLLTVANPSSRIGLKMQGRWMSYVANRLVQMHSGRNDGLSPYPGPSAIEAAWRVALEVLGRDTPTPSVVPGEDGAVQFVWHKAGWDISLAVDAFHNELWLRNRETGEMSLGSLDELWQKFSDALAELSTD